MHHHSDPPTVFIFSPPLALEKIKIEKKKNKKKPNAGIKTAHTEVTEQKSQKSSEITKNLINLE